MRKFYEGKPHGALVEDGQLRVSLPQKVALIHSFIHSFIYSFIQRAQVPVGEGGRGRERERERILSRGSVSSPK